MTFELCGLTAADVAAQRRYMEAVSALEMSLDAAFKGYGTHESLTTRDIAERVMRHLADSETV
jgi:hypothetical protein